MIKQINLIPKISDEEVRKDKIKKRYTKMSAVILGISALVVVALFLYQTFLYGSLNTLKKEAESNISQLNSLKNKETVLKGIQTKLARYRKLATSIPTFPRLLADINTILPTGIAVSDVGVGSDGKIVVTVISGSREQLDLFMTDFDKFAQDHDFKNIEVSNLNVLYPGKYSLSVKFETKADGTT